MAEISRQEEIISIIQEKMNNGEKYSEHQLLQIIKDCFAMIRLENEIYSLSKTAPFNAVQRERMKEAYDELENISAKYPAQ